MLSKPSRIGWRFPVQEPLIRAEVEEGQLRGPEDRFSDTRIAHVLDVFAIIVQLHAILGQGHRLIFQFERALIDPYGDQLVRQSSFAIQPPVLESDIVTIPIVLPLLEAKPCRKCLSPRSIQRDKKHALPLTWK